MVCIGPTDNGEGCTDVLGSVADDIILDEWIEFENDYGHDPDLDENGICRICGMYEPE